MKISDEIELVDLGIYLSKSNMLVIADTHIGYEEALNKEGILIPRTQFKELLERLFNIIERVKLEKRVHKLDKIIVNGDIKHEFGKISETEWRNTLKLLDFLLRHSEEVLLVKGNHDTILGPIAEKRRVKVVDEFSVGDILILHGDYVPKDLSKRKGLKTIIIGHEHSAVTLYEGTRAEKYKCYLLGEYKGKQLIVQPSFNLVVEGTNILADSLLSPFLSKINDFKVLVVGDKIYDFGPVKSLILRE